jgi:sigma-B regulation protein RsbU (phosphoserine phosphatase)
MTAWGSTDLAVEAMRRGACNFIQKPWDNRRVLTAVHKEARSRRLEESELEIAAAVQQRMLPGQARPMRTIDYAGRCLAARSVGGDYYDFLDLGGDTLGFVLADVSGKGVPAALLMANLQACFRSQAVMGFNEPTILLEAVNRLFYASTDSDRFATLFFASYHDRARTLRYVNCGHVAPLLLRSTGEMESLEPTATVLGAFREWSCAEREITLRPGDMLLLYSDGVTDGTGQDGSEFGKERIERALRDFHRGSAEDLVASILDAVSRFGGIRQGDDITMVAIRGV